MAGELPVAVTLDPVGGVPAVPGQNLHFKATFTVTGTNDGNPDPWTNDLQFYYGTPGSGWSALGSQVDDVVDGTSYYEALAPAETGPYFVKAVVIHTDPNPNPDTVTLFESNAARVYSESLTEKIREAAAADPMTGLTPRARDKAGND